MENRNCNMLVIYPKSLRKFIHDSGGYENHDWKIRVGLKNVRPQISDKNSLPRPPVS